ncbi:sugar phosphate isomerase/epimerase family protein [Pseudalkalibacillus caeni]|uniref:Sugar phosphate isomerase/epimerase n=1 Tax=Exobacillus caeni TaxID=2574798 RepID=A0A5R9F841_9BACL|nr:sugar phosphate isomerase/epimerase [Pseudalkalibacillus caeni]TLS38689.1 sugar phosphate isomerase/epimerase [Pseudalkalibacillus caeni]
MGQIPVGLQMYTLRKESEQDFVGTLEKVASLGYQGVEFAGYYGLSADELKDVLHKLGLQAASSHVPLTVLEKELDQTIDYQKKIGSNHIVCPFLPPERRSKEDYYNLINILNKAGQKCAEEGITFSYHNHDFELHPFDDGQKPLELLLKETNPDWVKAELDVYWLTKAGEDPVEWMKRYQNRTPLVHLKDMTTDDEKFFAELGTGGVNLDGVIAQGDDSNVEWWIVEQDQSRRTPLESIETSINYLKNKLVSAR